MNLSILSPILYQRESGDTMKNKKVLIIDDQKDFGFLIEAFFLKRGSLVFVANTISEGLQFLQEESPDFTFLDNNLPDGFGWSKTDFISVNYPETNLILITAVDITDSSSKSFRILHKPLLKDELRRMFP